MNTKKLVDTIRRVVDAFKRFGKVVTDIIATVKRDKQLVEEIEVAMKRETSTSVSDTPSTVVRVLDPALSGNEVIASPPRSRVPMSGKEPTSQGPTPTEETVYDGQKADHWVLSEEDRQRGFIRPVRRKYLHTVCGVVTGMPVPIAETYAVKPDYYGSTWCCGCHAYLPVGEDGDFYWDGTTEKVGT